MAHNHEHRSVKSEAEIARIKEQRFFVIRQQYPQIPKTIEEVTEAVAEGLLDIEVKLQVLPQGDPDWVYLPDELKWRINAARDRVKARKDAARAAAEAHRAKKLSPVTNIWTTYAADRREEQNKWFACVAWSLPEYSEKEIVLSGIVLVNSPDSTDGWMQGTPKYEVKEDMKVQNIRPNPGDRPIVRVFVEDELGDREWSRAYNPLTGEFYGEEPAPESAQEPEPTPEPVPEPEVNGLLFISGEVGGGRYGFTAVARPEYGIDNVAGSLEESEQMGILSLFEAVPGDGSGAGWIMTEPGTGLSEVVIAGRPARFKLVLSQHSHRLYKAEPGDVHWPSREERAGGIAVSFVLW